MAYYYEEEPDVKLEKGKIIANVRDFDLELYTYSGIFSWKRIDNASRLLAENMIVKPGQKVLDMGCGYGLLGIIAALMGAEVTMIDTNKRALKAARKNVKKIHLKAKVMKSNLYKRVKGKYDAIITNPPISAGMTVCSKIITQAPDYLENNGTLQLVARHNKGGERLMKLMQETFGNVRTIVKQGGFRVYVSEKKLL